MKTKRLLQSLFSVLFMGTLVLASSCKKNEPAKAEITVLNAKGDVVAGATVHVLCIAVEKSNCILGDTQTTDAGGITKHEFPHSATWGSDDPDFAVLKVEAFKEFDSTYQKIRLDSLGQPDTSYKDSSYFKYGEVFIELQINEVTKEEVTILQ